MAIIINIPPPQHNQKKMSSLSLLLIVLVCYAYIPIGSYGFRHRSLSRLIGLRRERCSTAAKGTGSPGSSWIDNITKIFDNSQGSKVGFISSSTSFVDVAIIGGGMSGLACAKTVLSSPSPCSVAVIEADSAAGGRVKSIKQDGYILDVGFQVFIDQYPDIKELFDYKKLELKQFSPGAVVRYNNAFHVVSDPFRRPQDILASLFNPIGSFVDKLKVHLYVNTNHTVLYA